jgi:hypothetical protein
VAQDVARVEHYTRLADGAWLLKTLGPGDVLALASVDAAIALDDLYLNVFPLPPVDGGAPT